MTTANASPRRSGRLSQPKSLKEPSDDESSDSQEEPEKAGVSYADANGRAKAPSGAKARSPKQRQPRKPRAADKPEPILLDNENLVERVLRAPNEFIKELIAAQKEDEEESTRAASVTLLNIVAQFCGQHQQHNWTQADFPDRSVEELSSELLQRLTDEECEDPFKLTVKGSNKVRKGPDRDKTRKKLRSFWYELTSEAHAAGLSVIDMLDPVTDFCTLMGQCVVWSARYASVTAALAIFSAFVDIIAVEEQKVARLEKAASGGKRATAQKGGGSKKGSPGVSLSQAAAVAKRDVDKAQRLVTAFTNKVDSMFDSTIVERCRDTQAFVRHDVVEAIGTWAAHAPKHYVNDQYLKYLAWGMSDVDPSVRIASTNAISKLLDDEYCLQALDSFIARFRSRCCELCLDVDQSVRLAGLKICEKLLHAGKVDLQQLTCVTKLLLVGKKGAGDRVRDGAAHLLVALLHQEALSLEPAAAEKDEPSTLDVLTAVRALMRQIAASRPATAHLPVPKLAALRLVSELQPRMPALTDWSTLAKSLDPAVCGALPKVEAQDMSTILACAVEAAAARSDNAAAVAADVDSDGDKSDEEDDTEASRPRRRRRVKGRAADDAAAGGKAELTLALMDAMPQLLSNHDTDAHMVRMFVGMLVHLDVGMYDTHDHVSAFEDLVDQIVRSVMRENDRDVLDTCLAVLARFAELSQPRLASMAAGEVKLLLDGTVERLDAAAEKLGRITDDELKGAVLASQGTQAAGPQDATVNLVISLARVLGRLCRMVLVPGWSATLTTEARVRASVLDVIVAAAKARPLPREMVAHALRLGQLLVAADLMRLKEMSSEAASSAASQSAVQQEFDAALLAVQEFLGATTELLTASNHYPESTQQHNDLMRIQLCAACVTLETHTLLRLCGLPEFRMAVNLDVRDALWRHVERLFDAVADAMHAVEGVGDELQADSQNASVQSRYEAAEAKYRELLSLASDAIGHVAQAILNGGVPEHRRFLGASVLAHCPLLHDKFAELAVQLIEKLKGAAHQALLPGVLVAALEIIYEELCQVEESRYGLEDFCEIAKILAQPLTAVGTAPSIVRDVWDEGLTFVRQRPQERSEFLTHGLAAFLEPLSADAAQDLLAEFVDASAARHEEGSGLTELGEAVKSDERWETFLETLKTRAAKPAKAPALRKKGGKARQQTRRITFHVSDDSGDEAGGDARARSRARKVATAANVKNMVGGAGPSRGNRGRDDEDVDDDIEDASDADDDRPLFTPPRHSRSTRAASRAKALSQDSLLASPEMPSPPFAAAARRKDAAGSIDDDSLAATPEPSTQRPSSRGRPSRDDSLMASESMDGLSLGDAKPRRGGGAQHGSARLSALPERSGGSGRATGADDGEEDDDADAGAGSEHDADHDNGDDDGNGELQESALGWGSAPARVGLMPETQDHQVDTQEDEEDQGGLDMEVDDAGGAPDGSGDAEMEDPSSGSEPEETVAVRHPRRRTRS